MEIPRFVPSEACLACDGCCRYAEAGSVWAPLFLFEEIRSLTERDIVPSCVFSHASSRTGAPARIDVVCDKEGCFCPCLAGDRHACKIYADRPFECRLYPFLLVDDGGRRVLGLDEHCPYATKTAGTPEMERYQETLKREFSSARGRAFLKAHPELFQKYPASLTFVADLSF